MSEYETIRVDLVYWQNNAMPTVFPKERKLSGPITIVTADGYWEILGISEGAKEEKSDWSNFLRHLVDLGLKVITTDACRGLSNQPI